jgi:hypothetical protein
VARGARANLILLVARDFDRDLLREATERIESGVIDLLAFFLKDGFIK